MTLEEFHAFCMHLPGAEEDFPFDQKTMVFKVGGKMFALVNIEEFRFVNLKVDPEESLKLQEKYAGTITPGYHMNKKHWISVQMDDSLPDQLIEKLVENSYNIVFDSLPAKTKQAIQTE